MRRNYSGNFSNMFFLQILLYPKFSFLTFTLQILNPLFSIGSFITPYILFAFTSRKFLQGVIYNRILFSHFWHPKLRVVAENRHRYPENGLRKNPAVARVGVAIGPNTGDYLGYGGADGVGV
jgi:hypothetical protein